MTDPGAQTCSWEFYVVRDLEKGQRRLVHETHVESLLEKVGMQTNLEHGSNAFARGSTRKLNADEKVDSQAQRHYQEDLHRL